MTDDDMIDQLIERHPSWGDDEYLVTLRARSIKALIRQAFQEGGESGRKRERAERSLRDIGARHSSTPDLFSKLFGFKP